MTNTFVISDTHFGHRNICHRFTLHDGVTPSRIDPRTGGRFESVESMDEYMIDRWNATVKDADGVYHLGDFCINRRSLQIFKRLKGRIALVLGNHDPWKRRDYDDFRNIDYFQGMKMFPKLGWVLTHCPVHPRQLQGIWTHNLHGHLHNNLVEVQGLVDPRYINVCVEQINYTPISFEEIKQTISK